MNARTTRQLSKLITAGIVSTETVSGTTTVVYKYNETIIFRSSTRGGYTEQLLGDPVPGLDIPPPHSFLTVNNAVIAIIGYLHETHFPTALFYKNGNVIKGSFKTFIRFSCSMKQYPETKMIAAKIKLNWARINQDTKEQLINRQCVDAEGNYIADLIRYQLLGEVPLLTFCSPSQVRRVHPSLDMYSVYTLVNLPYVYVNGSLQLNQPEFDYYKGTRTQCSSCGNWEENNKLVFGKCRTCIGDFQFELEGYSAKATSRFVAIEGRHPKYPSRLLGVELEYEIKSKGSLPELLYLLNRNVGGHAIFKRDGSLRNGVEICTRPASINIHSFEFQKMFEDADCMSRVLVEMTCGMHVHIDRRKMSALTLGKLISFMQNKHNQKFIETIAGRESNQYSLLGNDLSVTSNLTGGARENRYQGVNLQNEQTAEIRVFKTPDSFPLFLKNMEFVSALSDFVQPACSSVSENRYGDFLKFVKNNQSTYKTLAKFTKENF